MNLQPYDAYQPVESEWVEKLPEHWKQRRVKDLFRLITEQAPANNDYELLSLFASIGVRPRKDMEERGNKAVHTDGYWRVCKGDIVVNKLLAWMGAVGLSEYDGVTSPAYDILRKIEDTTDARYFTYLFRTELAQGIFKRNSRGIMEVRLRLYFDKLGALSVPLPPNQTAIADYLDQQITLIDRKITLLQRKTDTYQKLKQSLINRAVCRGLDDSVELVDSGTDWLGQIPKHWQLVRLKDLSIKIASGITPKGGSETYVDSGVLFLRSQNIYDEEFKLENASFITNSIHKKMKNSQLKDGDILINITGASIGRCCAFRKEIGHANINQHIALIRLKQKYHKAYFAKFLRSRSIKEHINMEQTGASKEAFNLSQIANIAVAFPSLEEQVEIAAYLDEKTGAIDAIISKLETQSQNLQTLRKTLINAVVTGKLKPTTGGQQG